MFLECDMSNCSKKRLYELIKWVNIIWVVYFIWYKFCFESKGNGLYMKVEPKGKLGEWRHCEIVGLSWDFDSKGVGAFEPPNSNLKTLHFFFFNLRLSSFLSFFHGSLLHFPLNIPSDLVIRLEEDIFGQPHNHLPSLSSSRVSPSSLHCVKKGWYSRQSSLFLKSSQWRWQLEYLDFFI